MSEDDHRAEAEGEHLPEGLSLKDGNCHAVDQHEGFEEECPIFIQMGAIEYQRGLCDDQEVVIESHQMPEGVGGRVIPVIVNDRPRKKVAVIFFDDLDEGCVEFKLLAEDQSAARGFENNDDHQHDRHRSERGHFGYILRETVVP